MVLMKYNPDLKEWHEVGEGEGGLYFDGFLLKKLQSIKYLQANNWDCLFIIVGMEGSGKSTLSFICGQYLSDMGITMDNLASGTDEAFEKLQKLPDGSTLIIDEAELMFSSKDSMKKEQRNLIQIMQVIRQKRMVLILVCPSFFDLSKYIAVDRSRFVIRVYTDNKLKRGRFAYWGTKKKIRLYENGKKNYNSYSKPKADFYGRFQDYKLPFEDEYKKLKLLSLTEAFNKAKKTKTSLNKPQKTCPRCNHNWELKGNLERTKFMCPDCSFRFKNDDFPKEK